MYVGFVLLVVASNMFSARPAITFEVNEATSALILFDRFETVFRTSPTLLNDQSTNSGIGFVDEPFDYLTSVLDHRDRRLRAALFQKSEAVLLGTKDYTPPEGLGRAVSKRCYVVILNGSKSPDFSQYLGEPTRDDHAASPVWKWSVDIGEFGDRITRMSSIFATQIGNSYFIVANNLDELQAFSRLVNSPRDSSVLSQGQDLDVLQGKEFWAYRRYKGLRSDSPATIFNGMKGVGPDAEALVLLVNLQRQQGILHFFSSSGEDPTVTNLNLIWDLPPARKIGATEWEIDFPLTASGDFPESSFKVWWLFGIGEAP